MSRERERLLCFPYPPFPFVCKGSLEAVTLIWSRERERLLCFPLYPPFPRAFLLSPGFANGR